MHRIDYPMADNAETLVNEIKSLQGDVPTTLYTRIWKHEVEIQVLSNTSSEGLAPNLWVSGGRESSQGALSYSTLRNSTTS